MRRFAASDGLEGDRETLLRAVAGELLHPFSVMRLQALRWCARPADARVGDWLSSLPLRYEVSAAGETALQRARREAVARRVHGGEPQATRDVEYLLDRARRERWPEYRR